MPMDWMDRSHEKRRECSLPDPVLHLPHDPGERRLRDDQRHQVVGTKVGGGEPVDGSSLRLRDSRPDGEVDDRLQDEPDQPDHEGAAVLELLGDRRLELGAVKDEEIDHTGRGSGSGASSGSRCGATSTTGSSPLLKTVSMTSSMGGSLTDRSTTGNSASRRAVTAAASTFGTRRVARKPSTATTSP